MNLGMAKHLDRVLGGWLAALLGAADRLREAIRPPGPLGDVRCILVVKFWGLGNWALLRPVVRDLRARYPRARLVIATLDSNEPLVSDLADEVLLVRPTGLWRTLQDLRAAVQRLRALRPQLALDFEQFARAGALLARLGGTAQRLGFRSGSPSRDGLYTATVPFRSDAHVSRSFRDLAEAAGVESGPYRPGGLVARDAGRREVSAQVPAGPFVVLHPGSGDNFKGRRWSATGFAAAGRTARACGRRVFVTGAASEAELARQVARSIGEGAQSLAGALSLDGLVALLRAADVLLSNDTGPVHLASQLGVPVLGFYGPNTPELYGPLAARSHAFYRGLPCSPCITTANYRSSRCRIHTCMAAIPVGEVTQRLRRLLEAGALTPDATRS